MKIAGVTTQADLNTVEAANILGGREWALRSRASTLRAMMTDQYVLRLHREMYGKVWRWAGRYRERQTNLGLAPYEIRVALRHLFDDVNAWLEFDTYAPGELAVRLHHRMVAIHPFINGNGRHARTLADMVLVRHFKLSPLPWGGGVTQAAGGARDAYLDALRSADRNDFRPLLDFAQSGN